MFTVHCNFTKQFCAHSIINVPKWLHQTWDTSRQVRTKIQGPCSLWLRFSIFVQASAHLAGAFNFKLNIKNCIDACTSVTESAEFLYQTQLSVVCT